MDYYHAIGNYVFSHFSSQNNMKITGNKDHFYFVLGWHIHNTYPDVFDVLKLIT